MGVNPTPVSGLPIPDQYAARDLPYWMGQLGMALDTKVVINVPDATTRDSQLIGAPIGTLVTSTTDGTVWVKTKPPGVLGWGVVWQPLGFSWTNITLPSGVAQFSTLEVPQWTMDRSTQWIYLSGAVIYSNGATWSHNDLIGTLPGTIVLDRITHAVAATDSPSGPCHVLINTDLTLRAQIPQSGTHWIALDSIAIPTHLAS